MKKNRVLHLFDNYPGSNSQNWLYKLLVNTPNTSQFIAADRYTKHNLYSSTFSYLINPLETFDIYKNSIPNKIKHYPKKLLFAILKRILGGYRRYLNEYLTNINFDLVHAHFANVACSYVELVRKHKLPLVVSFYGYDYEYLPFTKPEYKEKYINLFIKVDKFICEGTHGKFILQNMGCPEDKIEIIRLGVEIKNISFTKKVKVKNSLNLLQVANLVEKKGHIYSIKAFHKTLSNCTNMHLTIVGSGSDKIRNEISGYIMENNLFDKVTMINEIDHSLLYDFIKDYDVFIHPSCYSASMDCEGGAPVVLLDAQALGLPIISTTHCDIPDEVVHDKTGLLSPEKDISALSKSIKRFYEMDELEYSKFSLMARKHVEEKFDIEINAKHLCNIYNLVKGKYLFGN